MGPWFFHIPCSQAAQGDLIQGILWRIVKIMNNMRFEYNATKAPVTITLDALYTGMDATKYDGKITLQPFTAAVLIKIGASTVTTPPTPITVSAGTNSTLTQPNNATTLQANTNVAVTNYSWTKTAGPTQYTIVSPTTQSTNINNLVAGIYTFYLTVNECRDTVWKIVASLVLVDSVRRLWVR